MFKCGIINYCSALLCDYDTYIYLVPKETIYRRYLKLFYSKHETLTFVIRNVILDV